MNQWNNYSNTIKKKKSYNVYVNFNINMLLYYQLIYGKEVLIILKMYITKCTNTQEHHQR